MHAVQEWKELNTEWLCKNAMNTVSPQTHFVIDILIAGNWLYNMV